MHNTNPVCSSWRYNMWLCKPKLQSCERFTVVLCRCSVWSGWLSMSPISCLRTVKRDLGSSWPPCFWPVLAQRCAGRSSVPHAHQMWSSGVAWTSTTWCLSTLDTGSSPSVQALILAVIFVHFLLKHLKMYFSSHQKHSSWDSGTGTAVCWDRKRKAFGHEGHHQKSKDASKMFPYKQNRSRTRSSSSHEFWHVHRNCHYFRRTFK